VMVTVVLNVYKLPGCSHMFYTSLKASPNEDDNTGLNLLKLLDGEKASYGEKTLGQGPHVSSNPVNFPLDLDSYGNEFWLPKGNFEFGSSSGVVSLEDHPLSYMAEGILAQSLNADMERNLCNLWAENEDLKAKCEFVFSSYNNTLLDLNKLKQHEVDLNNMLSKVYKEKTKLIEDLGWVLKKEENRHHDPRRYFVPQRGTKAIAGLKSIKWECMNDVFGALVSLLRYVLRHHGEHSG
ncbi:hypothetical protein Tco_0383216, partial [Tanacetum coccineum]